MRIQFYATARDFADLLAFVWNGIEGRFYEQYSDYTEKLRTFDTLDELTRSLASPGADPRLIAFAVAEAVPLLKIKAIADRTTGRSRQTVEGWGILSFQFTDAEHPIAHQSKWPFKTSSVSVNTRARAEKWSDTYPDPVDVWPWEQIERAGRRIERYVRKASVARGWDNQCQLPYAAAVIEAGPRVSEVQR